MKYLIIILITLIFSSCSTLKVSEDFNIVFATGNAYEENWSGYSVNSKGEIYMVTGEELKQVAERITVLSKSEVKNIYKKANRLDLINRSISDSAQVTSIIKITENNNTNTLMWDFNSTDYPEIADFYGYLLNKIDLTK